jgi:sulfur-carrier protein
MIAVLVSVVLRGAVDGAARLSLQSAAEVTLGAVLDEIATRRPRPERRIHGERGDMGQYVNADIDGGHRRRLDGLTTAAPDGAEIQMLPSVAGG